MGQAQIVVNDRHYEVSCGDGEEDRLRELAAALDQRVRRLAASIGQVGEIRLLLLACLLMEDELSEATTRQPSLPVNQGAVPTLPAGLDNDLDALVRRVEAVAARLKQA